MAIFSANEYRTWRIQTINIAKNNIAQCKNEYKNVEEKKEWCDSILSEGIPPKLDTITIFFDIVCNYGFRNVQPFAPIFIIIVALWQFHKELKSGFIKYIILRKKYNEYIIGTIIKSWKYAFIFPLILLFIFLISYMLSGHFDINKTLKAYPWHFYLDEKYVNIIPQFLIVYVLNIILHSIYWINLGFIMAKKSRNIIVTLISTYIIYIIITMIGEVVVGGYILTLWLGFRGASFYFLLGSIWSYESIGSLLLMIIYSMSLALISFLILLKLYRKKEEVIIENEK